MSLSGPPILQMLGVGVITGFSSGMFGIGGGTILVPILVLLLGFKQSTASGTSLVALLLPVGFLGVLEYYRLGRITSEHIRFGLLVGVGIFFGTYLGARFAGTLSEVVLKRSFSVFLLFVAIRLWFSVKK